MGQQLTDDLENPTIEKRLNGEYTTRGLTAKVEVSPCSWMYANYGFQFQYRATDGSSWGHLLRKDLTCETATRDDVQVMLDALPLGKCDRCGQPHLVNKDGNRGETCEACFVTAINAKLEAIQAEQKAEDEAEDAKAKADGFRYKAVAWVHPPQGDDYQIMWYSKTKPTKAGVVGELRKRRSQIETDFRITKL